MIERSVDQEQAARQENVERHCYFCLEGWVFLGSVGNDGEEVIESISCRRCDGSGKLIESNSS